MENRSKTDIDTPSAADGVSLTADSAATIRTDSMDETADSASRPGVAADDEVEKMVGRVLANRYKIIRRIGTGGFGSVYEAEDTKIRKQVALKVLTRHLVNDASILARFRQEAESAGKVGHENIVDVTDFDRTVDGQYFMVMEYLDGIDLGNVIKSGETVPITRILAIMIQVCRALCMAHEKGVVHRDLKPGNIFLTVRGSRADFVKILDFGISKLMEVDEETCRLTKTGQIIGTPLYMAPEQAIGEENVDHRVDVYSLGVIMYELITGQPPFTAMNYLGIIAQHASDPPVPPSKVRPDLDIPPSLETIILKAMAKRAEDRYATMMELEGALVLTLSTLDPAAAISYSPDRTPPSLLTAQTGLSQRRLTDSMSFPIWGIMGGAALIGLAVALWAAWPFGGAETTELRHDASVTVAVPPTPDLQVQAKQPASAPVMVVLAISSKPSRATVLNSSGKVVGKTPFKLEVPRSEVKVSFVLKRRGYGPSTLELVPSGDFSQTVILKKKYSGQLPDDPKGWR